MAKLKYLCKSFTTPLTQDSLKDGGEYPVYGAAGIMGYKKDYSVPNDYLGIVKDGAGVGRINKYPERSSLLGTMSYIIPNLGVNIDWLKFNLISFNLGEKVDSTTIPHIYFKDYGNTYIRECSLEEQARIANFLDKKCAAIDNVQEKTKASIEEYKKLK